MGALRGRSLRHERGRKGRAHHDTDGDGGAVVGPRLPAGRGTLGASERAPFARPAQAWGVSRPPAHLSMPTPSVVPWARRTGPLPPPWLSSSLPVAGPMRTLASTGRSLSTACRRATPMVPLAHLSRGLRRDGPGRAKSRGSYDTSQFCKQFSPSCTAPHPYYQWCWTPVAVPPPFTQGQRLSVGLFFCGKAQACGGSWGFLRTTPIALRRGSGRVSLSPGGSSLLVGGASGRSPQAAKFAPLQVM